MARSSGVAGMVILVALVLAAESATVFGIRGLGELSPRFNSSASSQEVTRDTRSAVVATPDVEQERISKAGPEVARTVEESTADAAAGFSPERVQMEQSGWSCSGAFSSQQHAWYCAGRSVY